MIQLLYFYLYSFLGWIAECLYCGIPERKFINRGFLAGPYCPIYGCGAMLILFLLKPFEHSMLLIFLAGIVLTSALEYITSYLMEKLFHTKWWDYSSRPYNLHGRICLLNSLLFGIMGILVYYIAHPLVISLVQQLDPQIQLIAGTIISIIFLIDAGTTAYALARRNIDFHQVEDSIQQLYEAFKQATQYPMTQPLMDKVKAVLSTTTADERILQAIEYVHKRYDFVLHTCRHIHARLSRAFPNRIEELSRKNAQKLFDLIRQYKEGNK